ncbi:Glyoxylate/hydroxypyruvate reductase A [Comamonas sp. PE63]|uniref:Glyoxylate/hydroxypyruvate reductase A n=1 Tax=Comamonas brasiliensis TaxID=1812482 RepID=A0ABS5M099_9BURK|nr:MULTISPECIES: glyoxylate/hydroxypyruvate reductase A [Comamonas]MBS3021712.1 Glyoxylate/hydroxypyruvate reductase A [Comamonas sp. PE63]
MGILVNIHPSMGAPIVESLRALAPDVQVWAHRDEAPADAVETMLAWSLKPGVLPAYPKLKLLCAPSAGVDKLLAVPDLPAGLPVARTVDPQQHVEIAQYVVGTALRHTRELDLFARQQQAGDWLRRPVRASADCRVGILGLGEVGRFVAAAMQAVGYPVAGWSRSAKNIAGLTTHSGAQGLQQLLSASDILVCALPLTPETRDLLNRRTLSLLPRGAYFINVGRGEQVVEDELLALLDEGHLAGAALDVLREEPPQPGNKVWGHAKAFVTPHIAAQASADTVARQCLENLRRLRAGEPLLNLVDVARGY